ncbi:hypothetical protein [Paenibacillus gorillae]|uniref:hypothetical protein n=1 Tax=Paenibacillus gorillae TaxID=1243662 RepID=UPI0004BA8DC2|nr:hypothetical protein [Paenibacillus gorillae]
MALNRRLTTDRDFEEAVQREIRVRVFQDDYIVTSSGIIIRFDEETAVVQSSVSEIAYHDRRTCEFFEVRKK